MLAMVAVVTMMAIVIMTCLDSLPRYFKAHIDFMKDLFEIHYDVRGGRFTFLGHCPPSQALKLSLMIIT